MALPEGQLKELRSHDDSVRPEQLAETAYLTSFMKRQRHADPTFQHLTCSCLLATYVSNCALPLQPPKVALLLHILCHLPPWARGDLND